MQICSTRYQGAEDAIRLINRLTTSSVSELRFSANVLKTDSYNIQKKYNDAYAQTVRISRNFNLNAIRSLIPYRRVFMQSWEMHTQDCMNIQKHFRCITRPCPSIRTSNRFSPDIFLKTGSALFKTGNPIDAVPFLDKAVNLGIPSSRTGALVILGDCLDMLGRQNNAYVLYYEASKNKINPARYWYQPMLRMAFNP